LVKKSEGPNRKKTTQKKGNPEGKPEGVKGNL